MTGSSDKKSPRDATQADKFRSAARELETNNDPAAFDRKLKGLKLQTKKPPKPKGKS